MKTIMDMKPHALWKLSILVFTLFLTSCSNNFITGKRYHLNLVKAENQQKKEFHKRIKQSIQIQSIKSSVATLGNQNTLFENKNRISFSEAPSQDKNSKDSFRRIQIKDKNKTIVSIIDTGKVKAGPPIPEDFSKKGGWDPFSIFSFFILIVCIPLIFIFGYPYAILIFLVYSLLAIIFGLIGLFNTSHKKKKGRGFAILGFGIGLIQLLYLLISFVLIWAYVSNMG